MILDDEFDRVVVLTLDGREERARRTLAELRDKGLSDKARPVRAVDGKMVGVPAWWRAPAGAWGCLLSHARLLEDAMMDGVERLLVLEDDCVWQRGAAGLAAEFLEQVPEDWGQIYFGGQWRAGIAPRRLEGRPAVLRAMSVHRTHAYAVARPVMAKMHAHILHAPDYIDHYRQTARRRHVDHQLEVAHRRGDWLVYAPAFWLAGQGENTSDIVVGRRNPEQWWHWSWGDDFRRLPVVVTAGPLTPRQEGKLHFGKHLSPDDTTVDEGVRDAVSPGKLSQCIDAIAREALGMQRLPACHPWPEQVEWLRGNWPGGVLELPGDDELEALCDFPVSGLLPNPWWGWRAEGVMA